MAKCLLRITRWGSYFTCGALLSLGLSISVAQEQESGTQTPIPPTLEPIILPNLLTVPTLEEGIVYHIPEMEAVTRHYNIIYKKVDGGGSLALDVYYPPDIQDGERRPVVLFGHGRRGKDQANYITWGQLLAASGFVAVTFNYRDPEVGTNAADIFSDYDDVIAFVRGHAETFQVDENRMAIMTISALVRHGLSYVMRNRPEYIRAVVAYYGWMDDENPDLSPLDYLEENPGDYPPIFIARAGQDRIPDIPPSIDRFVETATLSGLDFEFMNYPEGQHGFDFLDDTDESREIIMRTVEFLRHYLLDDEAESQASSGT
jgi:acetyl esterase/lipase